MRTLRIMQHISLDGVIAPVPREGHADDHDYVHGGWTAPFRSPDGAAAVAEMQGQSFDLVLGRRTYDLWSGYWPTVKTGPFAALINGATKHVATHRPNSLAWGPVEHLGMDPIAGVRRLKSTPGPSLILWGSSTLTTPLLQSGLADEVVLIMYPVLLGGGIRLFAEHVAACRFELLSTRPLPTGVVVNALKPVRPLHELKV
jgi:dihydrofolate reductase